MLWPEPQNPECGWRGFSIPKYTKEFKLKLVLEYLSGKLGGYESVAKKIISLGIHWEHS